jgi:hypothetical protein
MRKTLFIILSIFLFMGFTPNEDNECKGKYQIVILYEDSRERMLMFDTHTARVYEYDWEFNHWRQLTFGSHIIGH